MPRVAGHPCASKSGVRTMALTFEHYRHRIAIADGDFGGELFLRGWESDVPIELAAVRRGDIVRDAVQAFLDAGADVLTTCTDRANTLAWPDECEGKGGARPDLEAANRETAKLFREAVSDYPGAKAIVLGALGPADAILLLEETDENTVLQAYRSHAQALADVGVDGLLFRSFTELRTLEIAIHAARQVTDLPVIGSMIFDCGLERAETALGVTGPQACAALAEFGVSAVGCEASDDPAPMLDVVSLLRASSKLPLWVSLRPGCPVLLDGSVRYPETPEEFGHRLDALAKAGASVVGGGSGVTTDHIAALAAARERLR